MNKVLCLMWGHHHEKWFTSTIAYKLFGEYRKDEDIYYKCKHCGARKS